MPENVCEIQYELRQKQTPTNKFHLFCVIIFNFPSKNLHGHSELSKPHSGLSGGGEMRPPAQWICFPLTYSKPL